MMVLVFCDVVKYIRSTKKTVFKRHNVVRKTCIVTIVFNTTKITDLKTFLCQFYVETGKHTKVKRLCK